MFRFFLNTLLHPTTPTFIGSIIRPTRTFVPKDCLQLDTKLVCVHCKTLQCECPARVEKVSSIRSLPEKPSLAAADTPSRTNAVAPESRTSRFAWTSSAAAAENDDRPASIRLASILGIKRGGGGPETGGDSVDSTNTPRLRTGMKHAVSQDSMAIGSSPASNWLKEKYQMATNKLMSKV